LRKDTNKINNKLKSPTNSNCNSSKRNWHSPNRLNSYSKDNCRPKDANNI